MTPQQILLQGLSPQEVQELIDISDYLAERVPAGQLAEGSVASLLNKASPRVREKLLQLSQALETPRYAPFQEKMTEGQRAAEFGLDPQITQVTKQALDGQAVAKGVLDRLGGGDSTLPQKEPSMRDVIEAAMGGNYK